MPRVNQRAKQSLNDTVLSVDIIYFLCTNPNFMCDYAQTSACCRVARPARRCLACLPQIRGSGSRDVVGVGSRGILHITRHVKQDN